MSIEFASAHYIILPSKGIKIKLQGLTRFTGVYFCFLKLPRVPQLWWTALRGPRAAPSAPRRPRRSRTPWARIRGLMAAVSFRSAGTGTGVLPRVDGNTVSRTAGRGFRPQAALAASLPVRAGKLSEIHPTAAAQSFAPARTAFPSTSSGHHPADGCAPPCDTPPPRDGAAFGSPGLVGRARPGPHPPRQPRSPCRGVVLWCQSFRVR